MTYTKEKKKKLGAFYTPQILADLLMRVIIPLGKDTKGTAFTVMDPATGDSMLLKSFANNAKNYGIEYNLIGLDIDKVAIDNSKKAFSNELHKCSFIHTDALYPLGSPNPQKGWKKMREKFFPNGIDFVVSNPPWGTSTIQYGSLSNDFTSAIGQFDIYDIFIETIITNLNSKGIYGIIVPDSIYCKEHLNIRKLLLTQTSIKGIVRLGEGFFPDVNFAVSIIYGIKKKDTRSSILCSHLNNYDRKEILAGVSDIYDVVLKKSRYVPANQMLNDNYSFTVDISDDDFLVLSKLKKYETIKKYTTCHRGVELSKKGKLGQCPRCGKWFPEPRKKDVETICPHCKSNVEVTKTATIITKKKYSDSFPIIVGEDIGRYYISQGRYIRTDFQGVNYKSLQLYQGTKTVVRKTGVGITVGIDYKNSLTNQVVYIIKPQTTANPLITAEVITAILSSRLLTYLIIKRKGSIGWTSNPYLSQEDVKNLPFPKLDFNDSKTISALKRITDLVREHSQKQMEIPTAVDAEIEKHVAFLYNVGKAEYDIIFKTISQVEQMIPFSRLLKIKLEDIFQDGI